MRTIALIATVAACAFMSGCWSRAKGTEVSLDGFREFAIRTQAGADVPAGSPTYQTAGAMPRTLAVVKVAGVYRCGDEPRVMQTVQLTEVELNELSRLGSHEAGMDVQSLGNILPPGSRVQESDLLRAAGRLNAEALLVFTYRTVNGHDMWVFPLLFTVGLAPVVNKSCETRVDAVMLSTRDGGLLFDGSGSDDGWQIANGYTADAAASQVEARVERRAFGRLIDRLLGGMNGPDVRERPEAMMGAW